MSNQRIFLSLLAAYLSMGTLVSVSVAGDPERGFGDIDVEPETLSVDVTPGGTEQTDFVVRNTGTGVLTVYAIAADVSWITADPVNFSLNTDEFQTVIITVDAAGLTPGTYDQTITIESNDVDEPTVQVPISVTVAGVPVPDISVDPSSLDLTVETGSSVQGTVSVRNAGGADLTVTSISSDAEWLSVSIESFTLEPDQIQAVIVTADAEELEPDAYEQNLTVTSNDPDEPELDVAINITVTAPQVPDIGVNPLTVVVTLGPDDSIEETIFVSNSGTADLTVTSVSPSVSWISVTPAAFSVVPNDSQAVSVTVDPASGEEGTYEADINISSNDPDEPVVTVSVTETLPAGDFGNNPHPAELTLAEPSPNPFSSSTTIEYSLPESDMILLTIHDVHGHRVNTLLNRVSADGVHRIRWNGSDESGRNSPAGTYFLRLRANGLTKSRRIVKVD